jgi:AraC family transcriptional activator of tynA and feaB
MRIVFSTATVHPRDRFDYWHAVACKNIIEHDSTPECRMTFQAELQSGVLDDIGLTVFENSPMVVSHSARHIAHASRDELFICRQISGLLTLEQSSREVMLEQGDIMLVDPRTPYMGRFSARSRMLLLAVPRRFVEARVGNTRDITARSIKPLQPETGLTSAFLSMLPSYADGLGTPAAQVVKEQVLDLVAVSLAKATGDATPRVSSARSLALMKVRAAIEARLTDPALDATAVSIAAGVTVRYANSVLSDQGTSIMRLIRARRLANCRRALEDPLQMHRMVSEIAYSWGFCDMTHFGRKFKATYGLLPGELRRTARAS